MIHDLRCRLLAWLEPGCAAGDDRKYDFYDIVMLAAILLSLVPLVSKQSCPAFVWIDRATAMLFAVDYLLRWATCDLKEGRKGIRPFLRYPFTFMAVVDLLSILPSLSLVNRAFKVLRVLRMGRILRLLRTFRIARGFRYSRSLKIIADVLRESKSPLAAVGTLAAGYILTSALIMFNAEPDTFRTFFDAVYWAAVSLTTVGYGDLYPVTAVGKTVATISSLFGVAVVALPSGIITAGYMKVIEGEDGRR